jgi:hypothetical protein
MLSPEQNIETMSLEMFKSPFLRNLKKTPQVDMHDHIVAIFYKLLECFGNLIMDYSLIFLQNKSLFIICLLFLVFYHFFAGKF